MREQIKTYAAEIAKWDRRIVEIIAIGVLAEVNKLDLVFTFEPEPPDDSVGFFWIANLLVRDEYEKLSEQVDLTQAVDFGFKIGEETYLPDGKILRELGLHDVLWVRDNEE